MMTSGRPSHGADDEHAPPVTIATAASGGQLKRGGGQDRLTAGGPPDGANAAPGRQEAQRNGERAVTEALVDGWMALATGGLIANVDDSSQLSPNFLNGVWGDLARAQYVAAIGEDPNWAAHATAAREATRRAAARDAARYRQEVRENAAHAAKQRRARAARAASAQQAMAHHRKDHVNGAA